MMCPWARGGILDDPAGPDRGMEMVFLPADPPRSGVFALFDPAAGPPAGREHGATLVLPGPAGPSLRKVPVHRVAVADAIPRLGRPGDDAGLPTTWSAWAAVVRAAL